MNEARWPRVRGVLRRLETPGLNRPQERVLNGALLLVVALFTGGWAFAIVNAATTGTSLGVGGVAAGALTPAAPPAAPFVVDRLLRMAADEAPWRGQSGALRAIITQPGDTLSLADTLGLDTLPAGIALEVEPADSPGFRTSPERTGQRPGVWNVLIRAREEVRRVTDLAVLTPVSAEEIRGGRIGQYMIGDWPSTRGRGGAFESGAYDPPRGLIRVTPENVELPISEHFVLGDFLTKGQENVWPKYTVVSPRVLDKIELTLQELERMGHPVENVGVISAFRTPHYNAHGGDPAGRGSMSRHMYGDAVDFYIDNDGDGRMDDLNGDGRVDIADARIIARAADRVERDYPHYVGGIGVYRPTGAHAGFVHVDTRGYRARW